MRLQEGIGRSTRTVLIDTNILVSGLVFGKGNEHQILEIAENKSITLVLPEFVLEETRAVLRQRFSGHEMLLDVYLQRCGIRRLLRSKSMKKFPGMDRQSETQRMWQC